MDLPADLKSGIERLAQGKSRRAIAQRAEAMSLLYRSGAGSGAAIRSQDDALAYAFTRLPATYDQGDLVALLRGGAPADLVIANYVVGEAAPDALTRIADALWSAASGM